MITLILTALEALASIVSNPALGLHGDTARISGLIGLLASLGREGEAAIPELQTLVEQIKSLDAMGGPIPDEVLAEWGQRHLLAKARIQAHKDP